MIWQTARSSGSGSGFNSAHGMSRDASHCPAVACSYRSATSAAQTWARSLMREVEGRRARLDDGASRAKPVAPVACSGTSPTRPTSQSRVCSSPPARSGNANAPVRLGTRRRDSRRPCGSRTWSHRPP